MPRKTVLVIEDEPDVADLIRETLEAGGYRCLLAGDADEADRMVASEKIDAVTLDVCMPGRSGIEWLVAMAASRPDLAARTVVVTGTSLSDDDRKTLTRHGAALLHKPFTLATLLRLVRQRESTAV